MLLSVHVSKNAFWSHTAKLKGLAVFLQTVGTPSFSLGKHLGREQPEWQQSPVSAAAHNSADPSALSSKDMMSFKSLNVLGGAGQ